MKREILILVSGLMLTSLCGCVTSMLTEQATNQAAPPTVEKVSFDVSTPGADAGTLMIQTRQPSYQMLAGEKYAIKIDTNAPLLVARQSDVTIKLDAGKHSLKLYSASANPADSEKIAYGEPNKKDVVIEKDQELKLKYTGAYRAFGAGNLEAMK